MEKTFEEYLEEKELSLYGDDDELLTMLTRKYNTAKEHRQSSGWETQADVGIQIMTNRFFDDKSVDGDNKKSKRYGINFVKRDLFHKQSELMANDFDVILHNRKNQISSSLSRLQQVLNCAIDEFSFLRKGDSCLTSMLFMGFGCAKIGWNGIKRSGGWISGVPQFEAIDPRKIFFDPSTSWMNRDSMRYICHVEQVDTEKLKVLYPEKADGITDTLEQGLYDNKLSEDEMRGITDVVYIQYRKTFINEVRAIIDEVEGVTKFFMDEEVKEVLTQKSQELTPEYVVDNTSKYEDDKVFPEGVVMSDSFKKEDDVIFQCVFIPSLGLILEKPKIVGSEFDYVILCGDPDPDSAYLFSRAWDTKDLLNIHSLMFTILLLNTMRIHKPIPIIESGSLEDEDFFLKNYDQIGVFAKVNPEWSITHPGVNPVRWLSAPASGQMQTMLMGVLEKEIDQALNSSPNTRGISEYASQSGAAVRNQQAAAARGDRSDFFNMREFYRKSVERLKYYLVKYKKYPFEIYGLKDDDTLGDVTVNLPVEEDPNQETNLAKASEDSYIEIKINENLEALKQAKEQKMLALFDRNLIAPEDVLRDMNIDNVEKIIKNNGKYQEDLQLAQMINSNPEIKEQVIAMLNSGAMAETKQNDSSN